MISLSTGLTQSAVGGHGKNDLFHSRLAEMPASPGILQSFNVWEASQCYEFGVCCLLRQFDFL